MARGKNHTIVEMSAEVESMYHKLKVQSYDVGSVPMLRSVCGINKGDCIKVILPLQDQQGKIVGIIETDKAHPGCESCDVAINLKKI